MPKNTSNLFQMSQSPVAFDSPALENPLNDVSNHKIQLHAFGQKLSVHAPKIDFLRADSLWRLRQIYEPALSTQTLNAQGVALDIGAGFGAFALPFALAYPGWRIFCFEPDPIAFSFLQENIQDLCLSQITALPFAVGHHDDAPQNPKAVRAALMQVALGQIEAVDILKNSLPFANFSKAKTNEGYLERGQNPGVEFDAVQVPTLAATMLDSLSPCLLKVIAPKVEAEILSALSGARIDHVIGESWGHIGSDLIHSPSTGQRQTWMPRAGQPKLGLRKPFDTTGRSSRLDIILALSSAADADYSCVTALLSDLSDQIRILAVGEGTADQVAVLNYFARNDPRLRFYQAPSRSQSAAWNFGRRQSTATHLAFVDLQSFPTNGFFSGLFDLARQTGAEVVQGPYHLIDCGHTGRAKNVAKPALHMTNINATDHFQFAETTYRRCDTFPLVAQIPSVWRRVYRRDFLDNRAIWFPEHIKSNGEFVFQSLSLHSIPDVPECGGIMFGRRECPISARDHAQCALESFDFLVTKASNEGWNDFTCILQAFASQVKSCASALKLQEQREFIRSAAALWANASTAFGQKDFTRLPLDLFQFAELTQLE